MPCLCWKTCHAFIAYRRRRKAAKKFSSIAGNWKMLDGQHPEKLLFLHRHFSANSSLAGPLLAGAPYYFFVSDDLQEAKTSYGRVITNRTWPLDGTEQVVGPPLGFGSARIRCSQVDSRCLTMELKLGTEVIELKFQFGQNGTDAQLQVTKSAGLELIYEAQFARIRAFPSAVGSQVHSSQATTESASACLLALVPFEPILESSAEIESTEVESMEN
ncbi:unnamed protein product [Polarella glacialis]|uniref:Uncharacterized protein n=1 Tax=Polarella glacialis TaxID=89957 RepID=A0A813DR75_POLGL|nr:unnamed protein product [Polarella glacialis]CAE8701644.1 unnamed protein product [Polarella glacialis]